MNTTTDTEFHPILVNGQPLVVEDFPGDTSPWDDTPMCLVCGRVTDHVAEHDDLVAAGVVEYRDGGIVAWTPGGHDRYDAAFAAADGSQGYDQQHDWAIGALIVAARP